MTTINVTHRCTDSACPYFTKPTDRGCLCHKSPQTMLEEAAEGLLASLVEVQDWIDNWFPNFAADDEWPAAAARMKSAIAKAQPPIDEVAR